MCKRHAGRGFIALCSWLVVLGVTAPASADPIVIASIAIESRVGFPAEFENGAGRFTLAMVPVSRVQLFSDRRITPASVGTTFVANAGNDPHFAVFAREMTNGRGNFIEWLFGPTAGGGGGVGSTGEGGLFELPGGILDFRGFVLDSITLRVDAFSSGLDPADPGFARLSFDGRLAVLGTGQFDPSPIPEPATLTLLTTGALGMFGVLRRGRRYTKTPDPTVNR